VHSTRPNSSSPKITDNALNPFDPYFTLLLRRAGETTSTASSGSGPDDVSRPTLHEYLFGSGSTITPRPVPKLAQKDLDALNLSTVTTSIEANPAPVRYQPDFLPLVVFHGSPNEDSVEIALGRAWEESHRKPAADVDFTEGDWTALSAFVWRIDLHGLRSSLLAVMKRCVEGSHRQE
jgi:hypothetical protein